MTIFLFISILSVIIPIVNGEGDTMCDCQEVGMLKELVQEVLVEQRLESARIRKLEARLRVYETTGPIPSDRLAKLEQNVKDINLKFNQTVTAAKDNQIGFHRDIGAIVKKTLISEKKERHKLVSNVSEKVKEHMDIIETFKVSINNTIEKRFKYITAKQVENKDTIETFKVAINNTIDSRFEDITDNQVKFRDRLNIYLDDRENDTASFIRTVFNNMSTFKTELVTEVNGRLDSIKELNNNIERISADLVPVNQSVWENKDKVDTLNKLVYGRKEWEKWSQWGECSAQCDAGLRERVRRCAPRFGCIGSSKDYSICNTQMCTVRLVGGSNLYEGRLEVWDGKTWGTVCDDNFDSQSATVVCKMLNYPHTNPLVFGSAYFGAGSLPILLDDVKCTGTEKNVFRCPHRGLRSHNCGHSEDVGLSCAQVRLVNGSNQYEGRLEVWHGSSWGTVCDDSFTHRGTYVVCKMLNFRHLNSKWVSSEYFGVGTLPIHLDDVSCTGSETSLFECPHRDWGTHNCKRQEDVGIICK